MKLRTIIATGAGLAIGYVLGTRAGRARFEELKSRASAVAHDPKVQAKVQDNIANLADQVRRNADKMPAPVSDVIKKAADQLHGTTQSDQPTS
ncbi:hypothetical protein GCM10009841_29970 [Microlunatus panaciterrae]|uniref:YtxH-like protein n=1 Tax=Microlunatus panaciterrae TaxID=400768 RepID=A0ABS2RFB4_9ACTN|nr:hypothetical protein [Microlunatus panaciterrae]MBM7797657.1 hypothetical protein [Microlunatus panaciterrae]